MIASVTCLPMGMSLVVLMLTVATLVPALEPM